MGNKAYFINNFRGIPNFSKDNGEFSEFEIESSCGNSKGNTDKKIKILGFHMLHESIKKGIELVTSYRKGYLRQSTVRNLYEMNLVIFLHYLNENNDKNYKIL